MAENDQKALDIAGKGLLGAVGLYGAGLSAKHGAKYIKPLGDYMTDVALRSSTIIDDFYKQGADKYNLSLSHFRNNFNDELNKFIKQNPNQFHKVREWTQFVKDNTVNMQGEYTPKDTQILKKAFVLENMKKHGINNPAELNALSDVRKLEVARGKKRMGLGKAKRILRHEELKNQMVKHVMKKDVNVKSLVANGLSEPQKTNVRTLFRGHERANTAGWKLHPDVNVTVSNILNVGGDKAQLSKAIKKDSMWRLGEYVAQNVKDLNNPVEVRAAVEARASTLGLNATLKQNRLHHSVTSIDGEIDRFMKNYRVTKDGKLNITFANQYKPHYLSGGTNTSATFWKGDKNRWIKLKNGQKLKVGPKLHHEYLLTDKYDMLNYEHLQKRQHFNIAHHTTTASKNKTAKDFVRLALRDKITDAFRRGDKKELLRLVGKGAFKAARFIGRKGRGGL